MSSDIAIVGLSGRFPGAPDVESFWSNLCGGVESIERWDETAAGAVARSGQWVRAGGELADVSGFDAAFFGIGRGEAGIMDPQHRLFLECAWEALESAALVPARFEGLIGVYGGCGLNTYFLNQVQANPSALAAAGGFQAVIAGEKDFLATQVAYRLNLRGPALTVQTACSTSLTAVQTACQALLSYQCDAALAGGATVRVPPRSGYLYQEGGILSPDGRCRPFSAAANGTVSGSGVGLVALRRLEDALSAGEKVVAVIKGAAINNDGADKVGFSAPGLNGQAAVIALALAQAGLEPGEIGYVEAHGTGTVLGDPVEVAALARVYGRSAQPWCGLGSVKSNVGHLDAAAGVAGLIKAALAVERGQIPPSLHAEIPNPRIDFTQSPFYLARSLRPWTGAAPRRAGVSSFGIGGTNVHLVLEEPPAAARRNGNAPPRRAWRRERFWVEREPAAAAPTGPATAETWVGFSTWKKDPLAGARRPASDAAKRRVLIFAAAAAFPAAWRAEVGEATWVAPGGAFRKAGEGKYEINPRSYADYESLAQALKPGGPLPRVLHAWCWDEVCPVPSSGDAFADWQAAGFYSLSFLARALAEAGLLGRTEIAVLARGVFQVTGSERLEPAKSTLVGLARVIPQEFPGTTCRLVDLEGPDAANALERWERSEAQATAAWRGRACWIPAFERVPVGARAAPVLRRRGVYLITGGLGNIGLALAEFLAERYQARLVLTGRSAPPPRERWPEIAASGADRMASVLRRLMAMESRGSEILLQTADAADFAAMAAAVREAEKSFGRIDGVIHGAGATGPAAFAPVARADAADCEPHFRAKARGVEALDRALAGRPLDFCVLLSSLSTVLGGLGFGAYAAANGFLDAYAELKNRTAGYPWISIAWDGWNFGGAGSGAVPPLAPAEGAALFERLVEQAAAGTWIVAAGDLEERRRRWLAPLPGSSEAKAAGSRPIDAAGVEEELARIWREVLGEGAAFDRDTPFFEAGGDSLAGIQMIALVNQRLQASVPTAAFFESPTLRSLARRLSAEPAASPPASEGRQRGARRRQNRQESGPA